MLDECWTWWCEQMLSLVPRGLRQSDEGDIDALVIELADADAGQPPMLSAWRSRRRDRAERLGVFAVDEGRLAALREAAGRSAAVLLAPPPGLVMEKRVAFPLSAERDLDGVVGYAMDRETPFAADEVWWSATVEERDRAAGQLVLRLLLVPRAPLADMLALLGRQGLAASALAVTGLDGRRRRIPLAEGRNAATPWRRRLMPLAAAGCGVLAVAVLVTPFVRQAVALDRVEGRIAAVAPAFDQATQLMREIDGGGAGGDLLASETARLGDPLKILAAATNALSDETYLTEFTLHQRQVTMVGQSTDAAALIGALARDGTFKDPAFAAPMTRLRDANRDLFSIKVEALP